MAGALKVRVLEVLLSLPISACIVSIVWFGVMRKFFQLPQEEGVFFQGGAGLATSGLDQHNGALFASGDAGDVPAELHHPDRTAISVVEARVGTSNEKQFAAFLEVNSTRKNFGLALTHMQMTGPAAEIGAGAGRGSFADVMLSTWATEKYCIIDPNVNSENDLSPALQRHSREGRVEVVSDYTDEAAKRFQDSQFSLIYINPSSSFRGLKKDLEDWWPKLKEGGILAGKDYCASTNEKSSPQHADFLRARPWCGTYHGGSKVGKEKAGFGRYTVRAVDTFAVEKGRVPHFTLEGRAEANPNESDGYANPSWWIVK
mmetsp:Transcript_4201/g.8660  ORF Transcript_4201/g.8660 Transcript_4201/m.8660 type:complete len:316 (-) Transcript_4201:194-1141(-)